MPIFFNNKEEITSPPVKEEVRSRQARSWKDIHKEIVSVPVIRNAVLNKNDEEKIDHYHHEKHGDLHKLINKKSEYLKDMLDFDN